MGVAIIGSLGYHIIRFTQKKIICYSFESHKVHQRDMIFVSCSIVHLQGQGLQGASAYREAVKVEKTAKLQILSLS